MTEQKAHTVAHVALALAAWRAPLAPLQIQQHHLFEILSRGICVSIILLSRFCKHETPLGDDALRHEV